MIHFFALSPIVAVFLFFSNAVFFLAYPLHASASRNPIAAQPRLVAQPISAPTKPSEEHRKWAFFSGVMTISDEPFYDPHGIDFKWAYALKKPLPPNPRIVVRMHGAGGGNGSMGVFAPSEAGDIEVRTQDADAYNQDWREWWIFGADGTPYPGRRIALMLSFVSARYGIDSSAKGIVLEGNSMGGGGAVVQTMILPQPWRARIAYSSGRIGPMLPRQVAKRSSGQYASIAPDDQQHKPQWDQIDFAIQAAADPIVRGMHYRHSFSSDDPFSAGRHGSTQLEFVNLIEKHRIGGAFGWVKADHGTRETGVKLPNLARFESEEQNITLDRAHPAITQSTGNYPLLAADRIKGAMFPRGHYNMGIVWDHEHIVDEASELVFPLKYTRRVDMGKDIPDQPERITISVTPRRIKNFAIQHGERLKWSFDNGKVHGVAVVSGDTVTVHNIPLRSGDGYKTLRIYR